MIKLTGINKIYRTNEIETVALENVNLEVNKGEFLSIMGPSGCGKSTLLNIMGLLDAPTSGTIEIAGTKVDGMKDKELAAFRNRKLGFVFDDPKPAVRREHPSPMGEKTGTWIGFAPFSAQQGKTYPEPLARETVRLLAGRYDRVFIHSGGGVEAEFAQEMERLYPNVTALFGRVKMAGEIDLIANLDCVVSMDSLVMHLASLVATPVVSVWGATHPGLGFFGYGCDPRGIVQADMECRPCSVFGNKPCRYGDYRCLHAVTPAMIVERVEEIVGK